MAKKISPLHLLKTNHQGINMKRLLLLLGIPFSLSCMEKTVSKIEEEKAKLKNEAMHLQTTMHIEQNISENAIVDWQQFFKNIEENATQPQQKEYKHKLLQKVDPLLFPLANRFDHRELLEASQFKSTDDGKKIITRDESTVITMPEGVPQRIALNANGTALAINYGNTLQVISKKNQWGNDTCERKQRYPIQSLAFSNPQTVEFTQEHTYCSFDTKTKILESHSKPSYGKDILISHDGRYLLYDFINSESLSSLIALKNLRTDTIVAFEREKNDIRGCFKSFAAHANGNFIFATESELLLGHNNNNGTYDIFKPKKKSRPPFIADCDVHNSGSRAVAIGDHKFCFYEIGAQKMKIGSMKEALHAVRCHPSDTSIVLATDGGIIILDSETLNCQRVVLPRLRSLALSADGNTIAAAGNDAVFILSRKDLKKSLSIAELMLIKRLATETSEKVFSATKFIEISKNIKNPELQQRLVKIFKLNYQTLRYDECSICKDNFGDTTINCNHSFCSNCIEHWHDEGKNTCPLCRAPISE